MSNIITGPLSPASEEEGAIITGPLGEGLLEEDAEEATEQKEQEDEELFGRKLVDSSMVAELAYDAENEEVEVAFANGQEQSYGCDRATYEELIVANSIGQFMHATFL